MECGAGNRRQASKLERETHMNVSSQSNRDLIADYLDAVMRKDASVVERFFAPEVEYMVNGTPTPDPDGVLPPISADCHAALPWLGLHRGREGVKKFLAQMHRNLEVVAFGPREVISDGNRAAAFGWFRLHALSSGRTVDIAYSIKFELRDGLIVKYHFLENTFDVAGAFRSGGEWLIKTDNQEHRVPSVPARHARRPFGGAMPAIDAVSKPLSIQPFTSSEPGAWSNSYLISGESEAILFDVFMLRSDAKQIADGIVKSGKTLKTVMISNAHPDHFMGLELITDHFPDVKVVSTQNVVTDIATDGSWMFSMLQSKLGSHGPTKLVIPEPLSEQSLTIEGARIEVVEFGEGESKHTAAVYIPQLRALLAADLVLNQTHLYLQERHLESWLARLGELESFAKKHGVKMFHPGHGKAGGLELMDETRAYLLDFAEAIKSGDTKIAAQRILAKYPNYHVKQFLTAFSLPAYFPVGDAKATA